MDSAVLPNQVKVRYYYSLQSSAIPHLVNVLITLQAEVYIWSISFKFDAYLEPMTLRNGVSHSH